MPAVYGLTDVGFERKPLDVILSEIEADQINGIDPALNVRTGPLAFLNGIFAERLDLLWQLLQAVVAADDINQGTGSALASLVQLTGTKKRDATKSLIKNVAVTVAVGAVLPAGSVASVSGSPSSRFLSATTVDNSAGVAPLSTAIDFIAETAGPVVAPAGSLVIGVSVPGWTSVSNANDATIGLEVETDSALRTRQHTEVAAPGSTTADAIRADIVQNLGQTAGGDVISVTVLANDSDMPDANGLPPHSVECIVHGAAEDSDADLAVAKQILDSKAAGDDTYGINRTIVVTDSQGQPHVIRFTRPVAVHVAMALTVTTLTGYPGDTALRNSIAVAQQSNQEVGKHVVLERLKSYALAVDGVDDVSAATLGPVGGPLVAANVEINRREYAVLNFSDIAVTSG